MKKERFKAAALAIFFISMIVTPMLSSQSHAAGNQMGTSEKVRLEMRDKEPVRTIREIFATEDSYVQGGSHADLTPPQYTSAPAWQREQIRVKNSNSNQAYTRKGYLLFDLSGEEMQAIKESSQIDLTLHLASAPESQFAEFDLYLLEEASFSNDTITWNTAPQGAEKITKVTSENREEDTFLIPITGTIKKEMEKGRTSIGFLMSIQTPQDNNGIFFHSIRTAEEALRPSIKVTKTEISGFEQITLDTEVGTAPRLPETIPVRKSDGTVIQTPVDWDLTSFTEEDYQTIGSFTVSGTLRDYLDCDVKATVQVTLPKDYEPKTYYVSNSAGNDGNDGLTAETPWKTLEKISDTVFLPGDKVLLKSGDIWNGSVSLHGSGTSEFPIVIDKYGGEARPIINGGGTTYADRSATVLLFDEEFWRIRNLEVTNYGEGEAWNQKSSVPYARFGILIYATDPEDEKEEVFVEGCYVHDVVSYGANNTIPGKDIGGKMSGGIVFMVSNKGLNSGEVLTAKTPAGQNRMKAVHNIVQNVTVEGIRNSTEGPGGSQPRICRNLEISNNFINGTLGDGIVIAQCPEGGLVEKNIVQNAGSAFDNRMYYAGVWVHKSQDVLFQHNEVYGMLYGNMDGEAFDADNECDGTIFQYNYSHNNNGGACLFMGTQTNTIFRYNVSANDGWRGGEEIFNDHSNPGVNHERVPLIYNNTIYIDKNKNTALYGYTSPGFCNFRNNLVLVSEEALADNNLRFSKAKTSPDSIIENNCFSNEAVFAANRPDADSLKAKQNIFAGANEIVPELTPDKAAEHDADRSLADGTAAISDPIRSIRERVSIFTPTEDAPTVGAGKVIEGNDLTKDIMGNPIAETPAIGAIERFRKEPENLVRILHPGEITGLPNGTQKSADALGLPGKVTITTTEGMREAEINWDVPKSNYDPDSKEAQSFTVTGTVILPEGVENREEIPLTVSVRISVLAGNQDIIIVPTVTLQGIRADKKRLEYYIGEKLTLEDLTVTAVYSNKSEKTVRGNAAVDTSAVNMEKPGTYPILITYEGKTGKIGITVKDMVTDQNLRYRLNRKGTAAVLGVTDAKRKILTIPEAVKVNGKKYWVTEISPSAFKNKRALTKVTIGARVSKIGANAFCGCKKLKTLVIKTKKLKKMPKNMIKGIQKRAVIRVPKKKMKAYARGLTKSAGFKTGMKLKKL